MAWWIMEEHQKHLTIHFWGCLRTIKTTEANIIVWRQQTSTRAKRWSKHTSSTCQCTTSAKRSPRARMTCTDLATTISRVLSITITTMAVDTILVSRAQCTVFLRSAPVNSCTRTAPNATTSLRKCSKTKLLSTSKTVSGISIWLAPVFTETKPIKTN